MLMSEEQTIVALSTPMGSGALAVIRLSGVTACAIVAQITKLASNKLLTEVPSHTVHYGSIVDAHSQVIDTCMITVMRAPRTFTGQDTVEITAHNNPFIIEAIIQESIRNGARPAQEGEFTRRAFLNNKIDLIQAEAINELIHANTQSVLKKALAQVDGSFSQWLSTCELALVKALAFCEASFEFLDDEGDFGHVISDQLTEILRQITNVKQSFDAMQQIRNGIRIALIGSVNAGKSSIFNALIKQDRAIVTPIAGTTRDTIEAGIYKQGNYWTIIDTAGIRTTHDTIEQEGIKRSWQEAHKADVVILVIDGARQLLHDERAIYHELYTKYSHKTIVVKNKSDLVAVNKGDGELTSILSINRDQASIDQLLADQSTFDKTLEQVFIEVSGLTKSGIDILEQLIEQKIAQLLASCDAPFLLNQRQFNILLGLEQKLQTIVSMLSGTIQYELISYHLRDSLEHLTELTGKSVSEAAMDAVFKQFCVGK